MKNKIFVAFVIDLAIAVILALLVYMILNCLNVKVISPMIGYIVWAVLICKDYFGGVSVGKRLVGIQVVTSNNMQIASPVKCVIRNLFYFLTYIDILVMFFNSKNMRLGDRVAHTEVTLRDKTLQKVKFSKAVVAIGYVLVGLIIVEIILYFRASSFGLL